MRALRIILRARRLARSRRWSGVMVIVAVLATITVVDPFGGNDAAADVDNPPFEGQAADPGQYTVTVDGAENAVEVSDGDTFTVSVDEMRLDRFCNDGLDFDCTGRIEWSRFDRVYSDIVDDRARWSVTLSSDCDERADTTCAVSVSTQSFVDCPGSFGFAGRVPVIIHERPVPPADAPNQIAAIPVTVRFDGQDCGPSVAVSYDVVGDGLTVAFDATGSFDPDGGDLDFAWDFAGEGSSTEPAPTFAFPGPGFYTASVMVTDDEGETASQQIALELGDGFASIAYAVRPNDPLTVDFDASGSQFNPLATEWLDFEWSSPSVATQNGMFVSITFPTGGSHQVTLVALDDNFETYEHAVTINLASEAPVADFTFTLDEGRATFDASASSDPDGEVVEYRWRIDGIGLFGRIVNHEFTSPGTHTVGLTVVDNAGEVSELVTRDVVIPFTVFENVFKTTLTQPAGAGATRLETGAGANQFTNGGGGIGDEVIVGPGTPREEVVHVLQFGSIVADAPLQFDHPVGEEVWVLLDTADDDPVGPAQQPISVAATDGSPLGFAILFVITAQDPRLVLSSDVVEAPIGTPTVIAPVGQAGVSLETIICGDGAGPSPETTIGAGFITVDPTAPGGALAECEFRFSGEPTQGDTSGHLIQDFAYETVEIDVVTPVDREVDGIRSAEFVGTATVTDERTDPPTATVFTRGAVSTIDNVAEAIASMTSALEADANTVAGPTESMSSTSAFCGTEQVEAPPQVFLELVGTDSEVETTNEIIYVSPGAVFIGSVENLSAFVVLNGTVAVRTTEVTTNTNRYNEVTERRVDVVDRYCVDVERIIAETPIDPPPVDDPPPADPPPPAEPPPSDLPPAEPPPSDPPPADPPPAEPPPSDPPPADPPPAEPPPSDPPPADPPPPVDPPPPPPAEPPPSDPPPPPVPPANAAVCHELSTRKFFPAQTTAPIALRLDGVFRVTLTSADPLHVPGHQTDQTDERWVVEVLDHDGHVIYTSPSISDLPDHLMSMTETVDGAASIVGGVSVRARHVGVAWPNSIRPVCVTFEPVDVED